MLTAGLLIPGMVSAHPGIGPSQWPMHVLSHPFAAWDHILGIATILFGLGLMLGKPAQKIFRYTGAIIALAGLGLFLV